MTKSPFDSEFKRKAPQLDITKIPEEMRMRTQWVLWKSEIRQGKPTKIPYQTNGKKADITNPSNWNAFEKVSEVLKNQPSKYSGLGYVFSEDDPYAGVDMDKCINENGQISKDAMEFIQDLESYTELSQSGGGLHSIVKARIPGPHKRKGHYEMYDKQRYFCFTGAHLEGTPLTIVENQDGMNRVYKKIFPDDKKPKRTVSNGVSLSDEELIKKASSVKRGTKFNDLYNGNWQKYFSSQSEADQSLCSLIAIYTKDFNQIDRIFRRSRLYREKWDREDYSSNTIENALAYVDAPSHSERKSQADVLLDLIATIEIEVFHDSTSTTYVRFPANSHIETQPTKAKAIKLWLAGQFYQSTGKAISPDALRQVLGVLEARAMFEGQKIELSLRVAERDGALWYDLANADWQAVKIMPGSWEVVDMPPPLFIRAANTAAQIMPKQVDRREVLKVLNFVNIR